jgi:arylsulfatase A-like enzyme
MAAFAGPSTLLDTMLPAPELARHPDATPDCPWSAVLPAGNRVVRGMIALEAAFGTPSRFRRVPSLGTSLWAGCLALGLTLCGCQRDAPTNVVLISVDTLRADRLNCYGYRARPVSPNIDALARDGILFENHVAAAPWTTPSHMSLLTSLYPTGHGVTASFDQIKRLMRGGAPAGQYERLASSKTTLAEVLARRGFATGAFTGGITLDPRVGFGRGFSVYETSMFKLLPLNVQAMYSWIEGQPGRPFFLFWHTFEVHAPYLETTFLGDVLAKASAKTIEDAYRGLPPDWNGRDEAVQILKDHGAFDREISAALYMGGVVAMDRWIGDFVSFLKRRDLYDRTLIVLTSDHGEQFGERPPDSEVPGDAGWYDSHGHTLFEELVHIPLVLKLPREARAGTRVRSVSSAVDVMPTILDVLSIPGPLAQMQGVSLRKAWEGPGPPSPGFAFSESLRGKAEAKSLRSERYKYILGIRAESVATHGRAYIPSRADTRELYDLGADPGEVRNLLSSDSGGHSARLADVFDAALRHQLGGQVGRAESETLDAETVEKLRSLGYVQR